MISQVTKKLLFSNDGGDDGNDELEKIKLLFVIYGISIQHFTFNQGEEDDGDELEKMKYYKTAIINMIIMMKYEKTMQPSPITIVIIILVWLHTHTLTGVGKMR